MKIRVTFKDPDALDNALQEAPLVRPDGLTDEEWEPIAEARREKIRDGLCATFIEYGEYITVEYDTEAKTCTVVPYRS